MKDIDNLKFQIEREYKIECIDFKLINDFVQFSFQRDENTFEEYRLPCATALFPQIKGYLEERFLIVRHRFSDK